MSSRGPLFSPAKPAKTANPVSSPPAAAVTPARPANPVNPQFISPVAASALLGKKKNSMSGGRKSKTVIRKKNRTRRTRRTRH